MITSPHNERVKLVRALQGSARARRKEGRVVLEGVRLLRDAIQRGGYKPEFVLHTPDTDGDFLAFLGEHTAAVLPVSEAILREISATEQPAGVIGVFASPAPALPTALRRVLILDSIRDPGNLGTLIRTAAAAGMDAVLLSPTTTDPYNPKALRAGMGAHFRLPVLEQTWDTIRAVCDRMRVYLADGEADLPYNKADWSVNWALIIGGEAHGAGDEARQLAHARIAIPMAADTESLNAAAAAAVILFEANQHS